MNDFRLATPTQILAEIGQRLRGQRLAKTITQQELATRASVALSAVKKIESGHNATRQSLIKVVQALSLADDLAQVFKPKPVLSIADMERAEQGKRQRARRPRAP